MTPPPPFITVNAFGLSDMGRVRTNNEDHFLLTQVGSGFVNANPTAPKNLNEGWIFIVADGMGGGQAGEVASQMAVELVAANFADEFERVTTSKHEGFVKAITVAVEKANRAVLEESQKKKELSGMGTTLTAAALCGTSVIVAQLGDSRAYLLRNHNVTQLTKDQSLVAQMVTAGKITPEEAKTHPRRNVILQALGVQSEINVEISTTDLKRGDQLVLCSDGLWGKVDAEEIKEFAERFAPQATCESLVRLANDRGGEDNITVIVASFSGDGLPLVTENKVPTLEIVKKKRRWWFWPR